MYCHRLDVPAAVLLLSSTHPGSAADAPNDLAPRPVSLTGNDLTGTAAPAQLAKQRDVKVHDRRQQKEPGSLKLNLTKVTFWEGLDGIAKAANARVDLYGAEGQIALVDGPWPKDAQISYSGVFRVAIKRLTVSC